METTEEKEEEDTNRLLVTVAISGNLCCMESLVSFEFSCLLGDVSLPDQNQLFPLSLLSVKILKASIVTSYRPFSATHCYVTLHLPTASQEIFRTQTVRNSYYPVWNETFYFRIQTKIKNIIQLEVCDTDPVTNRDIHLIVLFDLSKLQPGSPVLENFSLKPKKQEQPNHYEFLEVEFKLSDVPGPPEKLISNGVLVARELSILDVKVSKQDNEKVLEANKNVVFSVDQSYEGTQKTSKNLDSFRFHCIKSFGPVLKVKVQNIIPNKASESDYSLILPLKLLPVGNQVKVELPTGKGSTLELYLQVIDRSQNLDVRLGYELCPGEQDFLRKRKKVVADALYKLFNLGEKLQEDEVPVIGLLATGGGIRAMSSLYAHLSAFQKLNLLDCITYITSASGSTWTLTNLYHHIDWSHQSFEDHINNIKRQLLKNKYNIISTERLKQFHKELTNRIKAGHLSSFTALWALIQEAFLHNEANPCKLSDQQQALNQGQNPFPIYTAINVKEENINTFDFREWVEFNPYEVGFLKYGAQIRSEEFDSEFFMGRMVKKIPESRICYMEGIWTNIFSPNLLDCLYWATTPKEFWERWVKDMSLKHKNYSSSHYPATVYKPPSYPCGKLCEIFNDILTDRPLRGENYNFLQSFDFDKDYLHQKEFMKWSDVGYFMNNSGISLLKPERNVDIIILLDYGMTGILRQMKMMAEYCEIQGIPFPKVHTSEKERKNMKECYVFSDEDNPKAPIVICFPLVCHTFQEYSAPGVKRTPSEMQEGKVNLEEDVSPYQTLDINYTEENLDKLIHLCSYNILYSKDIIFQTIQSALQKKRHGGSRNDKQ